MIDTNRFHIWAFTGDIGAPWGADLSRKKTNGEMEDIRGRAAEVNMFNITQRDETSPNTISDKGE